MFGLPPGGVFRHSESFRTVFAADELLHVLQGTLVLANPETGEVVRADAGESVFFRRDTWHHAFAYGDEPLRVLELFAPPPATGTSGAYARTRPYLDQPCTPTTASSGSSPARARRRTLHVLRAADGVWRLDLDVLVGILVSTEHLTAGTLTVPAGQASLRSPTTGRSSSTSPAASSRSKRRASRRHSARATRSSCRPPRHTGTAPRLPASPRRSSVSPRASGRPEPRDMERAPAGARSDRSAQPGPASGAGRSPTSR